MHIIELEKHIGKAVTINGFAQIIRKQSKIIFLILRDVTGDVQVVVNSSDKKLFNLVNSCTSESVLQIKGKVANRPSKEKNLVEIHASEASILSLADNELPIPVINKTNDETDLQKRLDWRWLDIRKPRNTLIFKVWTEMESAFREFWLSNDYVQIYSPKFMSTPSESGAELFAVPYFDTTAYLAQSPQFYKQMAMASGLEKVFEVGPVFRANPSFTSRHDTEFTGYDAEMSYVSSHHDVMEEESKLLNFVIKRVKDKYGQSIQDNYDRELIVPKLPFPAVSFDEAKKILVKKGIKGEKATDLSSEEEKALSSYIYEKYNHEFVFIYDYPFDGRAFYSMRYDDNPKLSKSFDLLWNGLEITSGAQREHRHDKLLENIKYKKINLDHMQNYVNFFKFGCPPHGGFGMSPSRLLMKVLNVGNVREATFVYRGINRLDP